MDCHGSITVWKPSLQCLFCATVLGAYLTASGRRRNDEGGLHQVKLLLAAAGARGCACTCFAAAGGGAAWEEGHG